MQVKYDALLTNQTWNFVPLPPGKSTVGCKWVFRIKENSDGSALNSLSMVLTILKIL